MKNILSIKILNTKNIIRAKLSFIFLLTLNVSAQKVKIIEPAVINLTYKQTEKASCHFELRVGNTCCSYFCLEKFYQDSIREFNEEEYFMHLRKLIKQLDEDKKLSSDEYRKKYWTGPCTSDYLYKGPENQRFTLYTSFSGTQFIIKDSLANIKWNIVVDSTNTILGYKCTKATTDFRGRHWKVWFTEDIPVDAGPWKLHGLPGLILNAYCNNGISLECVSINSKNPKPVTFYNFGDYKFREIDRVKFIQKQNDPTAYNGRKIHISPPFELE